MNFNNKVESYLSCPRLLSRVSGGTASWSRRFLPLLFLNPDYLVMALAFFSRLRTSCVILSGLLAWLPARAQTTTVGTIEGRVFNPRTGEYL